VLTNANIKIIPHQEYPSTKDKHVHMKLISTYTEMTYNENNALYLFIYIYIYQNQKWF
jgi:hypothetical protein